MIEQLKRGIELFNTRDFFECHDMLEEIWMGWRSNDRAFFQGLIQIAAGFYHLENGNYKGAKSQLVKGISKLQQFTPEHCSIDLSTFLHQTHAWVTLLEAREQSGTAESFDMNLIPIIQTVNTITF